MQACGMTETATSTGRAVSGVEVRIVHLETGQDVPHGEAGEILVRRYSAMKGRYFTKTDNAVLGIGLGKNSWSLAGLDAGGAVVLRKRMTRDGIVAFAATLPACVVAMEACCGSHYLGRTLDAQGHTVRLMSPDYVQPYVKAQKTDDRDAEAIAEAATRPTMRFVSIKSKEQLDLQVLHRARERRVSARVHGL